MVDGSTPPASAAPQAAALRLTPADVLRLQRTIGNRAVQRLIESRRESVRAAGKPAGEGTPAVSRMAAGSGAVQRDVVNWMPGKYTPPIVEKLTKKGDQANLEIVQGYLKKAAYVADQIDEATLRAHDHVQGVVKKVIAGEVKLDGIVAALDGMPHAPDFANKLGDMIAGTGAMHPSAAGGYVIEDYVTAELRHDAEFQVTPPELQGSRPDVIFTLDPMDAEDGIAALYDITSQASAGHVLDKGGGSWVRHLKYAYVSELVYPPLKFDGTEARKLSEEEMKLVQLRSMEKMKAVEESAAQYAEGYRKLYEQALPEAAKRLSQGDRKWMKVGGRRGTSVLNDAGLLESAGGWDAVPFDKWWTQAVNDGNLRRSLETVGSWL